jgi:hypothetical protein
LNYTGRQGFFAHAALAVGVDGALRNPLGIIGLETLVRTAPAKGKRSNSQRRKDPANEQRRWARLAEEVDDELSAQGISAVHVMDREADAYDNILAFVSNQRRFIIRAMHDRAVEYVGDLSSVFAAVQSARTVVEREAPVSSRKPHPSPRQRAMRPPREARLAKLAFAAIPVQLKRPNHAPRSQPMLLEVNLVHVWEADCPEGEVPIEWVLLTNEPIGTPEAILRIVDLYRARWLIEEFFKALKTGCAYEKRQLESKHALFNALGLLIPVAVQLLRVRWFGRGPIAGAPATEVLSPLHIQALAALRPAEAKKWSAPPTARDAMLAIAAAGGHIKNNGEPGWQVLARGLIRFLDFAAGWEAAQNQKPKICDQS